MFQRAMLKNEGTDEFAETDEDGEPHCLFSLR